jgi:hypothetical protein
MEGPFWVHFVFGALFVAIAVYCASRVVFARRGGLANGCETHLSGDVSHLVMSIGMAAMILPALDPLPPVVWQVVFGFTACWFALRLVRRKAWTTRPDELHHVLGSLAMVYMFSAMQAGLGDRAMAGMSMGSGVALPVLAWAFLAYFLVHTIKLGAKLIEMPGAADTTVSNGPRGAVLSPQVLGSCRVVIGAGMSCMLVAML